MNLRKILRRVGTKILTLPLFYFIYGSGLKDMIIILFYWTLHRVIFFPLIFTNGIKFSYYSMKLYQLTPSVKVRFSYGIFKCRNPLDLLTIKPNYESNLTKRILSICKLYPGFIFLDGGSHIGRYSIMVSKLCNMTSIAVEPEKSNYRVLRENTKINSLADKIITINVALSNKRGYSYFYLDPRVGSGLHSLLKISHSRKTKVKTETIDGILRMLKIPYCKVKLIKLDIEGAELLALKGARRVLKFTPYIIFESLTKLKAQKIIKFLSKFGYDKFEKIDEDNYLAYKIN